MVIRRFESCSKQKTSLVRVRKRLNAWPSGEPSAILAASEDRSIASNAVKRLATSRRSKNGGVECEYKEWLAIPTRRDSYHGDMVETTGINNPSRDCQDMEYSHPDHIFASLV
jgi:hypothetical protein